MKPVFVDSSALVALGSQRDQYHNMARKTFNRLIDEGATFVTTNYIFDETLTFILKHMGHPYAVDMGERLKSSMHFHILHASEELEDRAWDIFKKYSDKNYSFTDCVSFAVMQALTLTEVLTHDHHFTQAGFHILIG